MSRKRKITNELKIKVIISLVLVTLLFLSFLFSDELTKFLHLDRSFAECEKTLSEIESSDYYVSYIDVGQGNSTFIQLPDGKTALIDGGNTQYGETVTKYLSDRKITTIDYMIASHSDSDHIGGLNAVLDNFEVKNIYRSFEICGTGTTAATFEIYEDEDLGSVYQTIASQSSKNKVTRVTSDVFKNFITKIYNESYVESGEIISSNVTVSYDGLVINGEGYTFEFFAPFVRDPLMDLSELTEHTNGYATQGYGASDSNGNSSIFLFTCKGDKYFFTGDAPFAEKSTLESGEYRETGYKGYEEMDFYHSLTDEERILLANINVYITGHHGSKYGSNEFLLELIDPEYIVISSGNLYDHPSKETIERIKVTLGIDENDLLRTDKYGTIEFGNIDGKVCYSLEKNEKASKYLISYELLIIIIVSVILIMLFSVKFNKRRKV